MGTHRGVVCLGTLSAFLAVVCIALAAVLIWREVFTDTTPQTEDPFLITLNTSNLIEIRQRFPGYFKTLSEQQALIQANANLPRPVLNVSRVYTRCFTNGYCELKYVLSSSTTTATTQFPSGITTTTTTPFLTEGQPGTRKRRQISSSPQCELDVYNMQDLSFHGCCVSYSNLQAPTSLLTAEPGQSGNVQIAQFPALKQYFEIQQCCQARSCTGCQCSQTYYVVSAVVAKTTSQGTQYTTENVRVPGCCKCLNISPSSATAEDRKQFDKTDQ